MKKFLTYFLTVLAITTGLLVAQQPSQSGKSKPQTSTAKTADLLDINSASAEDLDKLPGIGKAYSAKIIAGRPYKRKDELVNKKILPASVYAKIKDQIIAKQ
jgi:DNA uptake protein ComE-like DNA-binding protein